MTHAPLRRALVAALAVVASIQPAAAHDTWFTRQPSTPAGHGVFAIGTGNRFPTLEFPLAFNAIVDSGCAAAGAAATPRAAPLAQVEDRATSVVVRSAAPLPAQAAFSCWAQLTPFDVEVPADKIELYLREIQASPALRATWAAMKARGLPWRERYTKSARIELGGIGLRRELPLQMDVRLDHPRSPIRVGDELGFQVLLKGAPLAGLPVELVTSLSPVGVWRRTDAQGRIRIAPPLAGRWLVRAVDLRVSSKTPDEWESDFVTLAFDVAARAP